MPDTIIGLGLLILPLLALNWSSAHGVRFLAVLLLLVSLIWMYTAQFLRYYVPALPLLYLLAGHALTLFHDRRRSFPVYQIADAIIRILTMVWLLAGLPLFVSMYWNIPERIPYRVALGQEARQAYLSRILASYDAYQFLNAHHPGRNTLILSIGEQFRLYSSGTVETISSPSMSPHWQTSDVSEALALVRAAGFTHLLINANAPPASPLESVLQSRSFLDAAAKLEYARKNVYVYRFFTTAERNSGQVKRPARELLTNPGFEERDRDGPLGWQAYGNPTLDTTGLHSHSGRGAVQVSANSGYIQAVAITPGRIY